MLRVFRLPTARADLLDLLLRDDLVSRQSVTARDAKSLGLAGSDRYVVVEGNEDAIARAVDLLKGVAEPLAGTEADRVVHRFRSQDEDAAAGMGFIFGP